MSHLLFHLLLVFHHSRCDTASSLFASKCLGERYAWMAALCDLWDPGWGDPRFPHWALLLLSPSCMAPWCCSVLFLFCFIFGGHTQDDTQDVIVHLMSQSWQRFHFSVLCGFGFVFVLCAFCLVCFVCGLVFNGTAQWTVYRSITSARLRLLTFRRHCMIIYNSSFCCDWTRVTTWREPWRHWTEKIKRCRNFKA